MAFVLAELQLYLEELLRLERAAAVRVEPIERAAQLAHLVLVEAVRGRRAAAAVGVELGRPSDDMSRKDCLPLTTQM